MRTRLTALTSLAALLALLGGLTTAGHADVRRYKAKVFVDRTQPSWFIFVDDFRVNETVTDEGGVRYVDVRGPEGVFRVPFSDIQEIQFLKLRGYMDTDVAMYDARVVGRTPDISRYGVVWLRVMLGSASGQPWYMRPRTTLDRGARLMRIVFGDGLGEPIEAPKAEPAVEAPKPPPFLVTRQPAPPVPPAPVDPFAAMTLDELNANNPLADILFDFDKSNVRSDAAAVLQRNADWLKAHPTTKFTIEGYADPRGTDEYNLRLGERRADAVRRYLIELGIAAERIPAITRGETTIFCAAEPRDPCYEQNRRAHFVFTAK